MRGGTVYTPLNSSGNWHLKTYRQKFNDYGIIATESGPSVNKDSTLTRDNVYFGQAPPKQGCHSQMTRIVMGAFFRLQTTP
jgi:hypothetical protein